MPSSDAAHAVPAIEVSNLSVTIDRFPVLENISFNIASGEIALLVGSNGSGKTTLLRSMMGFISPDEGVVDIYGKPARRNRGDIGYVPQIVPFDRSFPVTAAEVVGMNLWNAGLHDEERRKRILWALDETGVRRMARQQIGELSGGQIQRVLIARAIARRPRLLIMDEPAAGIDAQGVEEFYDLLKRLKAEEEMTVLMVSHDIDVVFAYATHVLCINHHLICQGAPRSALTADVLKEMYGDESSLVSHSHAHGADRHNAHSHG